MTDYTNPTVSVTGTDGDDAFVFTAPLVHNTPLHVDGGGGRDLLSVDMDFPEGLMFEVAFEAAAGTDHGFHGVVRTESYYSDPYLSFSGIEVLEVTGTDLSDQLTLALDPGIQSETVNFDAGAGNDFLALDFSQLDGGFSFAVNRGAITSTYGQFAGFERFEIHGSSGDDVITTGNYDDEVWTGTGTDVVSTGDGDDRIYTSAIGKFNGGAGRFDIWAGDYSASTAGLKVNIGDKVAISNGTTATNVEMISVATGSGNDTFTVTGAVNMALSAGDGYDTLDLTVHPDYGRSLGIHSANGQVVIAGNGLDCAGFDEVSLTGSALGDIFKIFDLDTLDQVTLDGGEGVDTFSAEFIMSTTATRFVVDANGVLESHPDALTSIENFFLNGGSAADTFATAGGNDSLYGNEGNDRMAGGTGNDKLGGGGGDDWLEGGDGDDWLDGSIGNDSLEGGAGIDLANYSYTSGSGVKVRLDRTSAQDTGGAGVDTLVNVENLTGSQFADRLVGNALSNALTGGAGDDVLDGLAGADAMTGGFGDDRYYVDDAGDTVSEAGGQGIDRVEASVDFALSDNVENLVLRSTAQFGTGNGLDNAMLGSSGKNTLTGLAGADALDGGTGQDTLDGGDGNDALTGGIGKDRLTGGAGADQFVFRDGDSSVDRTLADVITDFSRAQGDRLKLSAMDANTALAGDQKFAFIGAGAFTHVAGQLHYVQEGGATYVEGDTNGDGLADFSIRLNGVVNLVSGDFVL